MDNPTLLIPKKSVPENSTCRIRLELVDLVADPVPGASLTTALMTVYNLSDGAEITGLVDVDVKPDVDGDGILRTIIPAAKNIILVNRGSVQYEDHHAKFVFNFTVGSDSLQLTKNFRVRVTSNPHHTPT